MNKKELTRVLKPLIKDCIKEVIFEDGLLTVQLTKVVPEHHTRKDFL